MERGTINKRNSELFGRYHSRRRSFGPDAYSVRTFDEQRSRKRSTALLFLLASFVASCGYGCNSLDKTFSKNSRLSRGEYAVVDRSTEDAWALANGTSRSNETTRRAQKPIDVYRVASETSSDAPPFTERAKGFFGLSTDASVQDDSRDGLYDLSVTNPDLNAPTERVALAQSDLYAREDENRSQGFWSKIFPPRRAQRSEETRPNIVPVPRTGGSSGFHDAPRDTESSPSHSTARPARNTFGQTRPNPSGGILSAPKRILGLTDKRRDSDSRAAQIESYDQSRFIPEFNEIEKYYYPSGTNVDGARSQGATANPERLVQRATHVVANERGSFYGKSVYGAQSDSGRAVETSRSSSIGQGNATERKGSAFLSPVARAGDQNGVSYGVTRPYDARANRREISLVSYDSRSPQRDGVKYSPYSLFGWDNKTRATLDGLFVESITNVTPSEANGGATSSFGRRTEFAWFNASTKNPATNASHEKEVEAEASELLDDELRFERIPNSDNIVNDATLDDALTPETPPVQTLARDAAQTTVVDPDASLDDIFDAAVFSERNADELVDEDLQAFETQVPSEEDFASIDPSEASDVEFDPSNVAEALLSNDDSPDATFPVTDEFPSPSESAREESTSEESNALVDSIERFAAPLEEVSSPDESLDSTDVSQDVVARASEAASFVPTPEATVNRRLETTTASMPLTNEEIAWVEQIRNAIQTLIKERDFLAERGMDVRPCDARLRLLYLVIGEYDRSIQAIQDDSDPLKVFWEKECRGLETLLQNRLEEIDPSFVAERLNSGLETLARFCDIKIGKAALVQEPAGYGLYELRDAPFRQGDTLFAYAELDYVNNREVDEGRRIDIECRWRLVDAYGNVVIPFESQRCSILSETKLRDVVLNVSAPLPLQLADGEYALELEVVDRNAEKPKPTSTTLRVSVVN